MLALEYADYPLSNRGLSFRDQRRLLRPRLAVDLGLRGHGFTVDADPAAEFPGHAGRGDWRDADVDTGSAGNQGPCACFTPVCFI